MKFPENADRIALFMEAASRLIRINRGEIRLLPHAGGKYGSWSHVYAGDVYYEDADGWVYVVFNDCASWDYIDRIEPPDGREPLDYDELCSAIVPTIRKDETALWPSFITHAWCEPEADQMKFWGIDENGHDDLPGWWD